MAFYLLGLLSLVGFIVPIITNRVNNVLNKVTNKVFRPYLLRYLPNGEIPNTGTIPLLHTTLCLSTY